VGQTIDSVTIRVRNTGTVAITQPMTVQIRAQNYENGNTTLINAFTQDTIVPALPVGQFVDVQFPLPVPTASAANLRLQGRLLASPSFGDQFGGNNDRVVEFAIVDTSNDKIYVGFDRFLFNDKYGVSMLAFDLSSDDLSIGIPTGMFIPAPLGLQTPTVDVIEIGQVYFDNDLDPNTVPDYDYYGYTLDVYEDLGGMPGAAPMMSFTRNVSDMDLPLFMQAPGGTTFTATPAIDTVKLPTPIVLPAGRGIYLRYTYPTVPATDTARNGLMADREPNAPASLNAYEITAGVWAPYREAEVTDFAIRAGFAKTGTSAVGETRPVGVSIGQNYPNPANGLTTIPFELRQTGDVRIAIRNTMGQLMYGNNLGVLMSGAQTTDVDTRSMPAGLYLYTITVNGSSVTRRMVVSN
jgi:Secretion system C-terminal sorting domain